MTSGEAPILALMHILSKFSLIIFGYMVAFSFFAVGISTAASPPGIKIAPLKYQESIPLGKVKAGFVDVSNPTNEKLILVPEIQAFRQVGTEGELQFYDDEALKAGVTIDVGEFELGPREAARIKFSIDPNKLPRGGVYAGLFFKTTPVKSLSSQNQVAAAARVGSLLILDIGSGGSRDGKIQTTSVPFLNFGDGIRGSITYVNTAQGTQPIAFNPNFDITYGFWGKAKKAEGPLVFPRSSRKVNFSQKGNFIGLVPVQIKDNIGHSPSKTVYVLALTGVWRIAVGLILIVLLALGITIWEGRRKGTFSTD